MHAAIIGFGCAGYHAAKELRHRCPNAYIDVFERTVRGGANPMLTTYYVSGRIGFEQMFPFGKMEDICSQLNLNLIETEVAMVKPFTKEVCTADGTTYIYDKLLISTGASALLPAFIKVEGKEVFLMRTVQEAQALSRYLETHSSKTASVIGASMVGIKVAELLCKRGIQTSLLDAADRIFPLAAYPGTAKKITEHLTELGLRLQMGVRVSGVDCNGVVFADGTKQQADIVCLCIGTRANLELVANTQMLEADSIAIGKGIIVNDKMETSCQDVYAAGDCCEGTNLLTGQTMIIGLWANAAAQGECAGSNMAGVEAHYPGSFPHNITHFFDMTFVGLGDPNVEGDHYSFAGDNCEVEIVMKGTEIVSMNILGDCPVSGVLKSVLIKQLNAELGHLSSIQRGMLERAGLPKAFITFLGGDYS